ncbi:MAG TPA: alpha-ketoglutarate-dependent dioxygenase AlkB [Candidatus Binatia bacterium]|jgi:alkylated DNA repair dioxygenase AlkB
MPRDSLFADEAQHLARLPIADAEVLFLRWLDLGQEPEAVLRRLIDESDWRGETIRVWDKTYLQPRLIAWHGDDGTGYRYSGRHHEPMPWTPLLLDLRGRVEAAAGCRFDSVLVNFYRDGNDSVAMHSDDEGELGPEPVIASLSLGRTRTFVMRHKTDRSQKIRRLELPSGSLLVMRGETQRHWQHGVPKVKAPCGPRMNLTFRRLLAWRG